MKRSFCSALLAAAFLFSIGCKGQPIQTQTKPMPSATQPSKGPESAPAEADQVEAVTKWMEGMKSVLPSLFCKEKSYFRECFQISAEECEAEAIRVTRVCVDSK